MSVGEHRTQQGLVLQVVGAMTGAAAVVVGVLYITGILVTSAELWSEHVSLRDTISLIPLQQLLSRGVSLVLPMLGVVAGATVLLALNDWAERGIGKAATETLTAANRLDDDAKKSIRTTAWDEVGKELQAAVVATDDKDQRAKLRRARRRVLAVHVAQNAFVLALMLVVPFFVPPVFSVAFFVVGLTLACLGARPGTQMLVVAYGILLIAVFLNPWLDPRHLPDATVSRAEGKPAVTGKLLFVADGTWYVARSGSLTAVPGDKIVSSTVRYPGGRRTLLRIIRDAAKKD